MMPTARFPFEDYWLTANLHAVLFTVSQSQPSICIEQPHVVRDLRIMAEMIADPFELLFVHTHSVVRNDIGESLGLSVRDPERVGIMHAMLNNWRLRVEAILPRTNPEYQPKRGND